MPVSGLVAGDMEAIVASWSAGLRPVRAKVKGTRGEDQRNPGWPKGWGERLSEEDAPGGARSLVNLRSTPESGSETNVLMLSLVAEKSIFECVMPVRLGKGSFVSIWPFSDCGRKPNERKDGPCDLCVKMLSITPAPAQ